MDALWSQIESQYQSELNKIGDRVVQLFKQAIEEKIYNYYEPTVYERTYMFLESVKYHYNWQDGSLFVFSDINTGYYSVVDGSDQTQNISKWLEYGHNDGRGNGQYHNYEGRGYLERAYELIKNEYPNLEVKIISDEEY
jgi:hypothetical protein